MRTEFNRLLMSRRKVMASIIALNGTLLLAACGSNTITVSQLQQDAQTLLAGMSALWSALSAAGAKLSPDLLAKAQTLIAAIQNNAQAIIDAAQSATSMSSISSVFKALLDGLNALVPVIAAFYPPASLIGAAVSAAVVLAQIIMQEAGIVTTAMKAISPADADNARRLLKGAAANGLQG